MPERHQLTELQLAILRVIWDKGEATVQDIWEALHAERGLAQTTVATNSPSCNSPSCASSGTRAKRRCRTSGKHCTPNAGSRRPPSPPTHRAATRHPARHLGQGRSDGAGHLGSTARRTRARADHRRHDAVAARAPRRRDAARPIPPVPLPRRGDRAGGAALDGGRADRAAVRRRRHRPGAASPQRRRREPRRPRQDPRHDRARRIERPGDPMTMFAWLLTYLIHSTVLLGLVWVVTRRGRVEPAVAELLWKVALLAGLVTGTIQARLQVAPPAAVTLPAAALPATPSVGETGIAPRRTAEHTATTSTTSTAPGLPSLPMLTVLLWATIALGSSLYYVARRLILIGRLADRRPVCDGPLAATLSALKRTTGFRGRVRLTMARTISSPVALGRSEICVPELALSELGAEQQRSMLDR